jgi:hypothetical protein
MGDDKGEISDKLNSALGLTGDKKVDWTKLSLRELFDVYGAVTGSRGGKTSASPMDGLPSAVRDRVMSLVNGMSEDEADMVMAGLQKRRDSLKGFPILNRALNMVQSRDQDKQQGQ